jgi:hypothetical protein
MMESSLLVRVLTSLPELEEIRRVWESWPGNRDSEIDTYLKFLQLNPGTVRPHVLVVDREGRPDAILVGRIDHSFISCRLGYLQLKLPAKILYFVYGALRGNPSEENCDLIVGSILKSLSDKEADVAYMNFLREGSDLCRQVVQRPSLVCRDHLQVSEAHYAVALAATADGFYKGLSSGARWQTKNKQKKLLKEFAGEVKIRCFRDVSGLEEMVRDVEQVAKKSYQRGLGVGFVDSSNTLEQLKFKAQRGWLRAYILYLRERPCAFWIGDINEKTFGSDYLAYDAEFAKYSPGMFLILKVIEGFCDGTHEGVTAVDFATGHAQYKEVLSNQEWLEKSFYIFAPTPKGISLNLARTLVSGMDVKIKKALSGTGLLRKIKKGWRARVRPQEAV